MPRSQLSLPGSGVLLSDGLGLLQLILQLCNDSILLAVLVSELGCQCKLLVLSNICCSVSLLQLDLQLSLGCGLLDLQASQLCCQKLVSLL